MEFKNESELIEWVYDMHLQNTNGRETEDEMFKLGIGVAIEELKELKLLNLPDVMKSVCSACSGSGRYCGKPCGACNGTGFD